MRITPLNLGENPRLRIRSDFMAIRVVPVADDASARLETADDAPIEIDVDARDGLVNVRVSFRPDNGGWLNKWRGATVVAHVPPAIDLTVESDAGEVTAERLGPGVFNLRTAAGRLSLSALEGEIRAHSEAGQVRGDALRGTFDLSTHAGQIACEILALDPGDHRFSSQVGEVRLQLGRDVRAKINTRTQLGSIRVTAESDQTSDAVISASTELGSIRINRLDEPNDRERRREGRHQRHFEYRFQTGPHVPVPPIPPVPPVSPMPRSTSNAESSVSVAIPPASRDSEISRVLSMIESGTISASEGLELLKALRGD